jgi:hypothetical protein
MKMKKAALLLPLFAAVYLFAFSAPPLYPGAKAVDELNRATQKAGQDAISYTTVDPFEKVYDFYKSKGTEVQTHHQFRAGEKYAAFQFKELGYSVTIFFRAADKNGTLIYVGKNPPGR